MDWVLVMQRDDLQPESDVQNIINAMFTWLCQIAAVFVGKRVGRRTIMLTIWPMLLLGLIGLCVSTAAFTHSAEGNKSAGVAW
jgi:SP family sugar:H+ symporter-like MFS transporter